MMPPLEGIAIPKPTRRGTTNRNERGNTRQRQLRRAWLVDNFRADVALVLRRYDVGEVLVQASPFTDDPTGEDAAAWFRRDLGKISPRAIYRAAYGLPPDPKLLDVEVLPACRCYRCGTLLHAGTVLRDGTVVEGTVTADRRVPGIEGGTYARTNIRPCCAACNSSTGGTLGAARKTTTTKETRP